MRAEKTSGVGVVAYLGRREEEREGGTERRGQLGISFANGGKRAVERAFDSCPGRDGELGDE